jgi:hypothetical protein
LSAMMVSIADAMENRLGAAAASVLDEFNLGDEFYPAMPPPSGRRAAWNSRGVRPE